MNADHKSQRVIRSGQQNLRQAALKRDGYTCRKCGLKPESPTVLEAAHIKAIAAGGVHSLDNIITLCANCHAEFDRAYLTEIIRESPGSILGFRSAIDKVRALNVVSMPSDELAVALHNLLFANVIAALETYLSDTIIGAIEKDDILVRRALTKVPELRERKVELCNIFDRVEQIHTEVRNYLLDVVYHNLGKIKPLYSSVLNVQFPDDFGDVSRAVLTRHDIVHRNSKTKDGESIRMTAADVEHVIVLVEQFVNFIDEQVQRKPWLS
jgi:hypothetical protein